MPNKRFYSAAQIETWARGRFGAALSLIEAGPRPVDLTLRLASPEALREVIRDLTGQLGLSLATVVAADETRAEGDFKVRYVLEPTGEPSQGQAKPQDLFVTVLVSVPAAAPEIPSITAIVPSANWHEREFRDLYGIIPRGHPDPRRLVLHENWPEGLFPLRKSYDLSSRPARARGEGGIPHLRVEGRGVFEIPVGPIHAGIIEPGHFRFSSVGETVLNLDARLFYTHRGLEKRLEGADISTAFHVVERVCGVCSVSHSLAFCEAVERIAGVVVPPRGRLLRSLLLELERLYNHVGDIGNICAGASYHYGTSAGLRIKESLQQLNESVSGNRFLRGLLTPGGLRQDLSAELGRALTGVLARAERDLEGLMERIDANPSVGDRFEGTGVLHRRVALDLGLTGIAARACGVHRDSRRDHPHAAFLDQALSDFKLAVATEGDVQARVRLRAAECRESFRLIRSALVALGPGKALERFPERPPAGIAISSVESARGAAVHWVRLGADGKIERYHIRSASFANWPAVPLAAQSAIVPDFPLINKSFELCYSCTDR